MVNKLLHEEVQKAAEQLRGSLRELILAAGCDPLKPQAVHRHINVDRVLCWKVSRMVRAERIEEALLQLPGEEALSIFITAFTPTTAGEARIESSRAAALGLNIAIASHVGNRRTLQLMLDSVPQGQDALAQSRKLLFRGASGLWGIQAKERMQLIMLAPNAANAERVDAVTATGWVDVKRMRPDARWRMVRHHVQPDGGAAAASELSSKPLSASAALGQSMLLPEFCEDVPPMITHAEGSVTYYELGPSATGRVGAFSLFLGEIQRGLGSRYARVKGESAEFCVNVLAPTEHLTLDVLVHRSLKLLDGAELSLFSAAFNDGSKFSDFERMGLEPEAVELENLSNLDNRHYSRHRELLHFTAERAGWKLDDFVGVRFEIDYPPFPSVARFRAPLEES